MDIISIQTVAGGTGVTTVATEVIDEWWGENVAILALDFGHNQELGLMLKDRDFELVADAAYMFWSDVDKKPKAREGCAFPRHSLMNLGDDLDTYRNCSEQALLGEDGHRSLEDAQQRLSQHLDRFAPYFDVCVVDLSKAPQHLMRMFIELSDEVRFCERWTFENTTWEAFHRDYLQNAKYKPNQVWMKYSDRGDMGPRTMRE